MADLVRPPLDFIVTREDWCRYDLSDNAILEVKVVLTRVYKQQGQLYSDFQPIYAILTNEIGAPDSNIKSLQVLQSSIVKDVSFTIITQDWNEYVVDDALLHNYEKRNLMFKHIIIYCEFQIIYQNPKPNTLMNCDKLCYATKQLMVVQL